jgi:cell division protein FtsW
LRVSYEYDRAARQVAKLRGVASQPSVGSAPATSQPPLPAEAANRGTSRLRQRVEPVLGAAMDLGAGAPRRPR